MDDFGCTLNAMLSAVCVGCITLLDECGGVGARCANGPLEHVYCLKCATTYEFCTLCRDHSELIINMGTVRAAKEEMDEKRRKVAREHYRLEKLLTTGSIRKRRLEELDAYTLLEAKRKKREKNNASIAASRRPTFSSKEEVPMCGHKELFPRQNRSLCAKCGWYNHNSKMFYSKNMEYCLCESCHATHGVLYAPGETTQKLCNGCNSALPMKDLKQCKSCKLYLCFGCLCGNKMEESWYDKHVRYPKPSPEPTFEERRLMSGYETYE